MIVVFEHDIQNTNQAGNGYRVQISFGGQKVPPKNAIKSDQRYPNTF